MQALAGVSADPLRIAAGREPRIDPAQLSDFMQFFLLGRIYWQEAQIAKEEITMSFQVSDAIGDVDDLIFQDCWLASDR